MSCVSFPLENSIFICLSDPICLFEAPVPTSIEATCQLQEHKFSHQLLSVFLLLISESVTLPSEYADYANIFDKGKTDRLPPHCSFDFKIILDGCYVQRLNLHKT